MRSPNMTDEEKKKHVDEFIIAYVSGEIDFFSDERKALFQAWIELYSASVKQDVKNRVKKII